MALRKAVNALGKALRETGQTLDRAGLSVVDNEIFHTPFSRHRTVMAVADKAPVVDSTAFVAPSAAIVGDVTIAKDATVWYGAVIRGDAAKVTIGTTSNVQDRAVLSTVTQPIDSHRTDVGPLVIGDGVTIGHGALLESCTVGSNVLVGQGAIVLEGVVIGNKSIIGAGAVVRPYTVIPAKQLWAGNPAKFIRQVTDADVADVDSNALKYVQHGKDHVEAF